MLPKQLSRNAASRRTKKSRQRHRQAYRRRFSRPQLEFLEKRLLLAQDLLIANSEADNILRFEGATGDPLGEFVSANSGGLVDPIDPTFGPDGNLYVISSESGHEKILRYDGGDGSFIGTFIDTGAGGFSGASAIEFGPDGDLYVATNTSAGVLRYDGATGAFETAIAAGEVARASGIAFGHDNNLYVMDSDGFLNTFADRITRYDPATGNLIDEFVAPGNLEDVAYFTFGPDGHLYVPDISFNDIRRFSGTTGEFLGTFNQSTSLVESPIFDVVFGSDGLVYATTAERIVRFDAEIGISIDSFISEPGGTLAFFPMPGSATDLQVTDLTIPVGAVARHDVMFQYTLTNNSSAQTAVSEWEDVLYLSTDAVFDPSDQVLGRVNHTSALKSGDTRTETLVVTMPRRPLGDYYVFVIADRNSVVNDPDRNNNFLRSENTLEVFGELATTHDATGSLAIGRSLSAYTTMGLDGSDLTITYSVYNLTDGYVEDALLETVLADGVSYTGGSHTPIQFGQQLAWHIPRLTPYGRVSIDATVVLSGPELTQIDLGPTVSASIDTVEVQDQLGAAVLRTDPMETASLAPTLDANGTDPFIQAKAAELNHDPAQILQFLREHVLFESYPGSLRGARGALWSEAANALDEASLGIALLRASGIPARYASGLLPDSLAKHLLSSMFPDRYQIVGFIPQGAEIANPLNDEDLLAETRQHYWIQYDTGSGFEDADTFFDDLNLIEPLPAADTTFYEVDESLRHKVRLQLTVETWREAFTTFGLGDGIISEIVLSAEFAAVELVGRSVTIGNIVTSNQLGALVFNSQTTSYTPFIDIGDEAMLPGEQSEVIKGKAFREVLTNVPLGNQVLSGLFLDIDLVDPFGTERRFHRALVDRIGFAARQGFSNSVASVDPSEPPALSSSDLWTLKIQASKQSAAAARLAEEYANDFAESLLRARQPDARLRAGVLVAQARAILAGFALASDIEAANLAKGYAIAAYFDAPRIAMLSSRLQTADGRSALAFHFDLIRDSMRSVVAPGQNLIASKGFASVRGVFNSFLEAESVPVLPGAVNVSSALIIQMSIERGIPLIPITAQNLAVLDALDLPIEAKARITANVNRGFFVSTPAQAIEIDGKPTTAWWRGDPETGEFLSQGMEGGNSAAALALLYVTVYAYIYGAALALAMGGLNNLVADMTHQPQNRVNLVKVTALSFIGVANVLANWVLQLGIMGATSPLGPLAKFDPEISPLLVDLDVPHPSTPGRRATGTMDVAATLSEPIVHVAGSVSEIDLDQNTTASFDLVVETGFADEFNLVVEAPDDWVVTVGEHGAVNLTPAPGEQHGVHTLHLFARSVTDPGLLAHGEVSVNITATQPDLDIHVTADEFFFLPANGGQLSTTFWAEIINLGPTIESVDLSFGNLPDGFSIVTAADQVKIPPGEHGIVGIHLKPEAPLPPPGSDLSFAITASGSVSETENVTFAMPEVHGIRLTAEPASTGAIPGASVEVSLMMEAVGNVPESIVFESNTSEGLAITGLTPVSLNPGESHELTLTLNVSPDVSLNRLLDAQIIASFGGREPVATPIVLHVASPGAVSSRNASAAAAQLGNDALAQRLDETGIALTNLAQAPDNLIAKGQVLAAIDAIVRLIAKDPVLVDFVAPLATVAETLGLAETPNEVQSAISAMDVVVGDLAAALLHLVRHNFDLSLTPNTLVAQPLVPAPFVARVHNLGTATTSYSLTLAGVPDGVTATLDQDTLTIEPGEFVDVPGSLTQVSTTELVDFDFSVDVAVTGITTQIQESAIGSVRPRNEIVSVTGIDVVPPFGDPGTQVNLTARLLNAVNRQQAALVSYSVTDPGGSTVFESPTPVPASLTVQTSLVSVDLGNLDTSGFAQGQHTIKVTVADADGNAIPGADATTPLIIGSPVEATLTVGPQVVPPGVSTVTNTLQVFGKVPLGVGTLKLVGMLPIEAFTGNFDNVDAIQGITLGGDTAYVHGNALGIGSLHVVDLSDPAAPTRTRAEIGIVSTAGAIDGDRLFAVDEGTTASGFSTLHVFDLNGGAGGTLEDPLLRDSISVPYIFGQDLVVSADSVFTAQAQVRFNGPNLLEQNGTILSFDVSDPADVQFLDSLFDVNGTTDDGNPNMGGNFYTRAFALADPTTLLVTSSTSTGSDTQTGTGRLLVVDVADPAAINSDDPDTQNAVVTELLIPGTTLIADVVVHGEMAYAIGSTGGFKNGDESDRAPTGDLVLASINISDPRNPVLTHTETLTRAARGALNLTVLGPGWLAISSLGDATADTPQLITIDVSDPGSFSFDQQLELTGTPEGMASDATHLYVTQSDGLFVYELRPDDPLELLAVAPIAGAAGIAVQNNVAYACGTDGISVLDYSNPASPTVVDTVGTGTHRGCRVDGDLLVAIRDPTARTLAVDVYSIQNDPLSPVLLGSSPAIEYANLESGIELTDSHAFVSQFGVCVQTRPATGNIVGMMGEMLSVAFNLDDPNSPTSATPELVDALFNTFGDNNTPPTDVAGCALSGGDHNVFGLTLASPDLAYLAAGSATVANPGGGVGRIHVVDISDPGAAQVVMDVDLPGTQQALGIGIDGNYGVVIGSTTGWNNPFDGFRAGNLTVTSLDLSDPLDPQVITTTELDRPARSFWTNFGSLGNNLFGFSSQNWQSDTQRDAKLLLIDLSNPLDPYVIETEVELDTVPPNSITADGDLLFTTDAGGVSIYRIGDLPRIPFTAQVQIPRNSGVSVVEASFNLSPDQIIANDPDFDTLVWNLALTPDADLVNLTWDSLVTELQPGQSRAITLDTTVQFAYQSAPGQLKLAAQSVAAEQILAINPSESAAQPGGEANFTLSVMNPRDVDVTYDLSSSGVPDDWIDLVSQVVVPAAGTVNVTLTLRPDSNAVPDDYGFVITATSHGTTGDVEGSLTVGGAPILPPIDRAARGVWVELTPMSATAGQGTPAIYTARVYNTGSESDEFMLFVSGLPAEFDTTINAGVFSVPAGASNFREFPVRITPPAGTAAADYPFTITAASVDHVDVTGPAAGSLTVVDVGVDVEIVPTSTDPKTSVQMTITNTGSLSETFDVSLAAPAALAATLGTATVTLQPGQSQSVAIDVGEIDFAFPGTLQLIGSARSQTQPTVLDAQSIDVNIAAVRAMTAEFERDTRTLPLPGVSSFLLLIDNVGNVEDEYTARIISTDGPVSAALTDLDGVPAQEIPLLVLPGLSRGGIVLDTELTGFGNGTVTVQVRSLNDATILAEDTITVMTDAEFDFGDAPEGIQIEDLVSNYPTRLGSGGARHALVDNGPRLGPSIDVEPNGQPSELADGDGIDEDGVIQIASFVSTASQSTLGSVLIDVSGTAKLDAWIDFNRNGRFDHPAEHLGSGTSTALAPGANIVPVTVPPGASVGTTYARFRISTLGGLAPGGEADDGEVEDYRFEILDGTSGADAIVNLIVGDVNVIGDGGDVVVLHETTELFRVPGAALAGLGFQGTDEDDLLSLGNLGAVLNAPIPIGFHGSGGSDTLKLADRDQLLDLTDDDLNPLGDIEVIDVVGASPNHLILDVVSVVASTDIDNSLLVIHDDDDTVHYAGEQWTVNLPIFVDGAQRHHLTGGGATVETLNTRPWTNPYIRTDVDRSGSTSPRDALLIINLLGREAADTGSVALPDPTSAETIADWYYDVNGSRFASPLDALQVINFIAVQQESEGAAGEALLAADLLTRRSALGDATEPLQSLDTAIRNAPMSSLSIDRSWPLPTGRRHWPETADTDLELSFVDGNRERSLGELDAIDYSLANDPAQPFLWRLENGELDATLADCSLQSLGHTDKS